MTSTVGLVTRRTLIAGVAGMTLVGTAGCMPTAVRLGRLAMDAAAVALGMETGTAVGIKVPKVLASTLAALSEVIPKATEKVVNYGFVEGQQGLTALVAVPGGPGVGSTVRAAHNTGGEIVCCPALVTLGLMEFAQWHTRKYETSQDQLRDGPMLRIDRGPKEDDPADVGSAQDYMLEMMDGYTIQVTWKPTKALGQMSTLYVKRGLYRGGDSTPTWSETMDVSYRYNEVFVS